MLPSLRGQGRKDRKVRSEQPSRLLMPSAPCQGDAGSATAPPSQGSFWVASKPVNEEG